MVEYERRDLERRLSHVFIRCTSIDIKRCNNLEISKLWNLASCFIAA